MRDTWAIFSKTPLRKKEEKAMGKKRTEKAITVVHPVCCGLDVHKKVISACLLITDKHGNEYADVQEFETFTDSLIELRKWLLKNKCPVVALESTGIYWRPIHNILEDHVQVVLVNPRHVKNLPGHKTDIEDSRWLASLLKHGLVKGSFIPPKEIRKWRDHTRLRVKHVRTANSYKQRTQKLLESANIKIDSVLSDLFGVSGRRLLKLLAQGNKPSLEDINQVVHGSVKGKSYELFRSIQGYFTAHHALLLRTNLETIEFHERQVALLDECLETMMAHIEPLIQELDKIPGIDKVAARAILAEIGISLDDFKSSGHLSAWAGLCPGNNESAGKRKTGRSPVKKHVLKTVLVEVAWAAIKKKNSFFKEKYYRLKSRTTPKKAIVAIAHKILKVVYHIVKHGVEYQELGAEYLHRQNEKATLRRLEKQAANLGLKLVPIEA